jgi:hypothetical protein
MNKGTASVGVGVGVGALALTAGIIVSMSGGASASGPATIHVQELAKNVTYVPVGQLTGSKAQSNQGDYVVFHDPLVKPGTTTTVGHVDGACWLTAPKTGLFYCSVNFSLSGKGQVASTGKFDSSGQMTTTASITGGTGSYASATGTVAVKALSQTKNDFTIDITG